MKTQSSELRHDQGEGIRAWVKGQRPHPVWWKINDLLKSHDLELTCPTLIRRLGARYDPRKSHNVMTKCFLYS